MKRSGNTIVELIGAAAGLLIGLWLALLVVKNLESQWRWVLAPVVFVATYIASFIAAATVYVRAVFWLDDRLKK